MAKILLVDDDKMLSSALTDELREEGHEVTQAFDGEEGFNKAKEMKPDIILLDIMMPKMDGFEVLSGLKQDDETASIPIVIMTVSVNQDKLDETLANGARDAIIKSRYTLKSIADRVADIV